MDLDYAKLSDAELRDLLDLPPNREGLRYYLSKSAKIEYLSGATEERKEELLSAARDRQLEHHVHLRHRRVNGSPDRQALIEERMGGQVWRYLREEQTAGFKDNVTGRRAKIAHVVVSTTSGQELRLVRQTLVDAHERLGLILGWPAPKVRTPAPEAAQAGLLTAANLPSAMAALRAEP